MALVISEREIKEVDALIFGQAYDPHAILGLHNNQAGKKVICLWRPGAEHVYIDLFGQSVKASQTDQSGFFEVEVPENTTAYDYKVYHNSGLLAHDPYAFWPSIGELDLYLYGSGVHYQAYEAFGGRIVEHQNVKGVRFCIWAPSAKSVSLVADFNHFDGRANPMRSLGSSGVWELFVPGIGEGEKYKFEIRTQTGELLVKSDPFAYSSELRPLTASVVRSIENFTWTDKEWLGERKIDWVNKSPLAIYEVHLGSWKRSETGFRNYRDIAVELANYCCEMGFTHVELMPIQEHPLDESWGYQVTGFYAVTSRFGTPEDFQWFVNHLHNKGIGVILDWVPGHFPTDAFSLARFDGTHLYEHADPRQGFHPHWNTAIFNFGRKEVSNFLIANALFWFEKMHIDGLRVDAVASMLYLDYGREEGQWIPNQYGGKENLEAIEFFKHLNAVTHDRNPGCLMIAEESTAFTGVSHSVQNGGLGFDMKWNMGWMNDTLKYFAKDMLYRNYHQNELTFGLIYAFSERFVLVFSHDEVVHGKNSLISKMPGDLWQKFANLRLLYSYMICQPGKKLLFMGGELAQWNEWHCKSEIEWNLLQFPYHQGVQNLVKNINHFYLSHPALWENDFSPEGFEWVDFSDTKNCVLSYLRKSKDGKQLLFCIHNFTPAYHGEYRISLKNLRTITEVFNTDQTLFGGSSKLSNHPWIEWENGRGKGCVIELAPLATQIFEVTFDL